MKGLGTPRLEPREAEDFVRALLARLPGYVPGWVAREGGAGYALIQIYARYLQALAERLNLAPDKLKLAFLDALGIDLLPAQAARAPLVFQALPHMGDARVPARTQAGAQASGQAEPLIFETEEAIGLAAARLAQVVALWPGQDAYADHSAALLSGEPFRLFEPLQPIPHELYLAHDTLLALAGRSTVDLEVELATPGTQRLDIAWEYWDGMVWRGFKAFGQDAAEQRPKEQSAGAQPQDNEAEKDEWSFDATEGLTRNGTIRLVADCAETARTRVHGHEGYWIRGRLCQPLSDAVGTTWPNIDQIQLRTQIRREPFWTSNRTETASKEPWLRGVVRDERGHRNDQVQQFLQFASVYYRHVDSVTSSSLPLPQVGEKLKDEQTYLASVRTLSTPLEAYLGIISLRAQIEIVAKPETTTQLEFVLTHALDLDKSFADSVPLVLDKGFMPFGPQPQAGSCFYFTNEEIFSKGGARLSLCVIPTPDSEQSVWVPHPFLTLEYWNGTRWTGSRPGHEAETSTNLVWAFRRGTYVVPGDIVSFDVPRDLQRCEVNGVPGYWMRIRIVKGRFARKRIISESPDISIEEVVPPMLEAFTLGYRYETPLVSPERCLTRNDFRWEDRSTHARLRGTTFQPFVPSQDPTPALYMGFDRPLPADRIGIYIDVAEGSEAVAGPLLQWEYWDDTAWQRVQVEDETRGLARPGMVRLLWPGTPSGPTATVLRASGTEVLFMDPLAGARFRAGDRLYISGAPDGEMVTVEATTPSGVRLRTPLERDYSNVTIGAATLPRFGTPRTWLRARMEAGGEPPQGTVNGIHVNAVWAAELQTFEDEIVGSTTGQPSEAFFLRRTPVLAGEIVEVRELIGPRAEIELPILRRECLRQGLGEANLRTGKDRRTGRITEVWVRWQARPHLLLSAPDDRHYRLERSGGRLLFGDGKHGKIPPLGAEVRVRGYQSGGGVAGNVPAGAITQVLSGVPVQGITNPRAAEGGAGGESVTEVLGRGPQTLRHRRQAIALADYEALAREASPAVAVARALPATHPTGRQAPGWVKLIIMPQSEDPQPQPSLGLRHRVWEFLAARVPAAVAGRVTVRGPVYLSVGVAAFVVPVDPQSAGVVRQRVELALADFLHPLRGGPEGEGWPFGRDLYLSDAAAVLEAIDGVDYLETLDLLLDGTPRGEQVEVPPDRIVVAGRLDIRLSGGED